MLKVSEMALQIRAARVSTSGLTDPALGYRARCPASWRRGSEIRSFIPIRGNCRAGVQLRSIFLPYGNYATSVTALICSDAGADPRRALHHGRRHDADRGGLRRRGRREHHPQAAAIGRLQRRAGPARHRLHRRDRQDFAQVRQSLDHPRRIRRGRAAGAAEDHGGHRCLGARRAAASTRSRNSCRWTPRASCSCVAEPSQGWRRSSRPAAARPRSASPQRSSRRKTARPARSSATSSRKICSNMA
jgi:hypothetical protein